MDEGYKTIWDYAPWAAGTGLPAASPYTVGVESSRAIDWTGLA